MTSDDEDEIVLTSANDNVDDDMVLPFQLEKSNLKGRIVRLGPVVDEIITAHDYPPSVAQLTGEMATLTLLLGGMLKYDGTFTMQAQGDGPVRLLVGDLTTTGEVRAMAGFNAERLDHMAHGEEVVSLRPTDRAHDLGDLLGKGYLAFTVDQGEHTERYQGIVELQGATLAECAQHYFEQSEQIKTVIKLAARPSPTGWRGGGIMLQRLPLGDASGEDISAADEDWTRAVTLLHTCSEAELTEPELPASDLLFRLFHEEGVRVYNPLHVTKGCRCNLDKLRNILALMAEDDLDHMMADGVITMTCEFCNKDFSFTRDAVRKEQEHGDKV